MSPLRAQLDAAEITIKNLRVDIVKTCAELAQLKQELDQLRADTQAMIALLEPKAAAFDRVLRIGDLPDDVELPEDAISKIAEIVTDYYAAKARLER